MDTSVRPPRVPTRSFPLMTVPYTAGAPCSYWTLTCLAVSSALHSLMGFLFVSPVVCLQLPSDSISRWTPLLFGYPLPTAGRGRDFHPLERAPAGRTNEIKHAARVLSSYRDARRTRILRIRLRLTVRVNKRPPHQLQYSRCGGLSYLRQKITCYSFRAQARHSEYPAYHTHPVRGSCMPLQASPFQRHRSRCSEDRS